MPVNGPLVNRDAKVHQMIPGRDAKEEDSWEDMDVALGSIGGSRRASSSSSSLRSPGVRKRRPPRTMRAVPASPSRRAYTAPPRPPAPLAYPSPQTSTKTPIKQEGHEQPMTAFQPQSLPSQHLFQMPHVDTSAASLSSLTSVAPLPRRPRKIIDVEKLVDGAIAGTSFTIQYVFDVLSTAIRLLRRPLYLIVFLWLLALVVGYVFSALRAAFAPLCWLPGLNRTPMCRMGPDVADAVAAVGKEKGGLLSRKPQWADYPALMSAQSVTFEHLLDESVGGSGLSLEIKKAEMATSDLVTLVRVSDMRSRDLLAEHLMQFLDDARKTSRRLQQLSSKTAGAVDSIMAVNDYALHTIEAAQAPKGPVSLFLRQLTPSKRSTDDVVTQTFTDAMSVLSSSMQRLVLEAQANLDNLDRLEEHLTTLHEIVVREDAAIADAKAELLAVLWTHLGFNQDQIRRFDENLVLLRDLGLYRKKAVAHVVAALQTLQGMSADMEEIRERVTAPELTGSKIPVEVHIKSIRAGLERLKEGQKRARRLQEAAVNRVLEAPNN